MRAAVMRNSRLVIDTFPDPTPGEGEVLVKTLACGICGSDQAIAEGKIDVAPMITGNVGIDGVPAAFDTLATPDTHAKILVEPWRG